MEPQQWQILTWLSLIRLICIVAALIPAIYNHHHHPVLYFEITFLSCYGLNDFILLVWDIPTMGQLLTTVGVQIVATSLWVIISVVEVLTGGLLLSGEDFHFQEQWEVVLSSVVYTGLFAVNVTIISILAKSKWWKHRHVGVKQLGRLDAICSLTLIGKRRPRNDVVSWSSVYLDLLRFTGSGILQTFTRRVNAVQDTTHVIGRNAFAFIVTVVVLARAIQLVVQLFTTGLSLTTSLGQSNTSPFDFSAVSLLFLNSTLNSSAYNISRLYNEQSGQQCSDTLSCAPFSLQYFAQSMDYTLCFPTNQSTCSDEPTSLHIQLSANANLTTSDLGQFWLLNRPEGLTFNESWSFSQETLDAGVVLQSIPGSQLLPGQQLIGRIGFSQRRVLERTFYTILGLSSPYTNHPLFPITWLPSSTVLQNSSVASATLSLERMQYAYQLYPFNDGSTTLNGYTYQVIADIHSQDLFSVLASVGGLIAALQTLHTLIFGMPLFFGLFGSKPLNPFGFAGKFMTDQSKTRLRERYGQLPEPSWSSQSSSGAEKLALFMCEFVLQTGPLAEKEPPVVLAGGLTGLSPTGVQNNIPLTERDPARMNTVRLEEGDVDDFDHQREPSTISLLHNHRTMESDDFLADMITPESEREHGPSAPSNVGQP